MLGKRGRAKHAMRRTTSLTDFAPPDALAGIAEEEEEQEQEEAAAVAVAYRWMLHGGAEAGQDWLEGYRASAAAAPVGHQRNSADYSAAETAAFLRACGLCRRRLGPGRDTFMYKGDTAFCSLECRQQHITNEEWKEKCALTSGKEAAPASGGSEKPGAGGTVAAAS